MNKMRRIPILMGVLFVSSLAIDTTAHAQTQLKPAPGVFVEFAPYQRRYDVPLSRRDARLHAGIPTHGKQVDLLDANPEVFRSYGAQALEYWFDVSRFSGFTRSDRRSRIPWNAQVFLDDLNTYGKRGMRHVTSFAVRLDGQYVKRHGPPPLEQYRSGLLRRFPANPATRGQ